MISVVVSTYNAPDRLEKALWGFSAQTDRRFELLIADDGSTKATRDVVDRMRAETGMEIRHLWHPDEGFRKTVICNRAFAEAAYDYILVTDGDCIPRADLVATHLRFRRPGCYLGSTALRLPANAADAISKEEILSGRIFNFGWLWRQGFVVEPQLLRLACPGRIQPVANRCLCRNSRFHGANSSAWKSDILWVNGYDERLSYGGQDAELGYRLRHAGVRPIKVRCSAHCLHIDHERAYAPPEVRRVTREAVERTRQSEVAFTPYGIVKAEGGDRSPGARGAFVRTGEGVASG